MNSIPRESGIESEITFLCMIASERSDQKVFSSGACDPVNSIGSIFAPNSITVTPFVIDGKDLDIKWRECEV